MHFPVFCIFLYTIMAQKSAQNQRFLCLPRKNVFSAYKILAPCLGRKNSPVCPYLAPNSLLGNYLTPSQQLPLILPILATYSPITATYFPTLVRSQSPAYLYLTIHSWEVSRLFFILLVTVVTVQNPPLYQELSNPRD